jgi:hypothetical protein
MAWPGSGRLGHSLPPDRRGAAAAARCLWTGCAAEQGQQAVELADDQEEQAKRNGHDRAGPLVTPITVGQELRPTSGTPYAGRGSQDGPGGMWQSVLFPAQLVGALCSATGDERVQVERTRSYSRMRNRNRVTRSPRSVMRLRACSVVEHRSGWPVMSRTCR